MTLKNENLYFCRKSHQDLQILRKLNALSEDKPKFPLETTPHHSLEKPVCATCNQEIDNEISRVLLMRDKDGGPRLLCFHFFFPCWDFELLVQKYPNLIIDHGGFSIPQNLKMNESSIINLQKNAEFWSLPLSNS